MEREGAALGHGLEGVLDEVDQDLLDLGRVNGGDGQLAGESGAEAQAAVVQLRLEQFNGFLDDVIERGGLELRHRGPDRLQELGDDVIEPVDFATGDRKVLFELGDQFAGVGFCGEASGARGGAKFAGRLAHDGRLELSELALHELQVDVKGVEGVADFMGDAGGEQGQRLNPLALNGLDGLLARFGGVVQDKGDAGAAGGFAIQRGSVEPQEARAGIVDLELVAHDALAACGVEPANLLPFELGDEIRDGLALDVGLQAKEAGDGLVVVENAAGLIHDQHAVFDGVEERLEEAPFARQALHDGLQPGLVQPPDAGQHLVEETGLACHANGDPGAAGAA